MKSYTLEKLDKNLHTFDDVVDKINEIIDILNKVTGGWQK